jgi:Icc-related predicted phosphoesterase
MRQTKSPDALVIVCMADTHLLHKSLSGIPGGHILVHAGDVCHMGRSRAAIADFNAWLGDLPHTLKVLVPGNHDVPLAEDVSSRELLTNAVLLIDEGIEFEGLRLWGSPVLPLCGGAFNVPRPEDRRRIFAGIPENTDVLITHGPAYGILDAAPGSRIHIGDPELLRAVQRIRPPLAIAGHAHQGHGVKVTEYTVFVNASLMGDSGGICRDPIALRIPRR